MKLQIILILLTTFVIFEICQSRKSKNNFSVVANTQKGYAAVKKFILKKSHRISKRLQRSICKLPKAVGLCQEEKTRYYYDSTTKQCKSFIFTGCRGNQNNFRSLTKCEKACKT